MNDKLKKQLTSIIEYLKVKREANAKDIAKHIGEQFHNGSFKAMLSYLVDCNLIKNTRSDIYTITPNGEKFQSFEQIEEDQSWQIRLAKSNIEANDFQKQMARKNHKWMIANITVGSILCLATVLQVLLLILRT